MDLFLLNVLNDVNALIPKISLTGNWLVLLIGLVLIIGTIALILSLKKIIINSVLGVIAWAVSLFVFHSGLPLIPSLVVSIVFGPAGIGVMLLLGFLGVI